MRFFAAATAMAVGIFGSSLEAATLHANAYLGAADVGFSGVSPRATNTSDATSATSVTQGSLGAASFDVSASVDSDEGAIRLYSEVVSGDETANDYTEGSANAWITEEVTLSGSGTFTADMAVDVSWGSTGNLVSNTFYAGIDIDCLSGNCDSVSFLTTVNDATLVIRDGSFGWAYFQVPGNLVPAPGVLPVDFPEAAGSIDDYALFSSISYTGDVVLSVSWVMSVENGVFGPGSSAIFDASQTGTIFAGVTGDTATLSFATNGFLDNAIYPADVGLDIPTAPVPLPAGGLLLLGAIAGLAFTRLRA